MRYLIGIDLGTTNSCVAYVDTQHPHAPIVPLQLMQLMAPGSVVQRPLLPSCCYLAGEGEWPQGTFALPWAPERTYAVGTFALEHGARVPTRLVTAAKSWLCHSAASRRDPILPISSDASQRISPLEASARYLTHIAEVWNWTVGASGDRFEEQEVILTVPASFDEVARALTAEAAKRAGYGAVTLLEEPQAAFYSWIDGQEGAWESQLQAGNLILVCDVGGGTTDFSLIEVGVTNEGMLTLQRKSVGDHLLLGGDNIDAAIAHAIAAKVQGGQDLTTVQWLQLIHQARRAKERLLGAGENNYKIAIAGTGSQVVKGSFHSSVSREELLKIVCEGFFGIYPWEEALTRSTPHALRTLELPYEEEASITKQLAHFLKDSGGTPPTHLLFNGGTLKPKPFQEAILNSLNLWFGSKPNVLIAPNFDSSVARGAAYYGKARRGLGVRIGGGSSRSYYLAIQLCDAEGKTSMQALTLLPRGVEEGTCYTAPHTFMLTPNIPVSFDLYTSHTRLCDHSGDFIPIDPLELHRLPPIETALRYGKQGSSQPIAVQLSITLTAIGTLELSLKAVATSHCWALEFQLRSAAGQEDALKSVGEGRRDVTYDAAHGAEALDLIIQTFQGDCDPKKLLDALERVLEQPRLNWSPSLLRALWAPLLTCSGDRFRSLMHEERWWHLTGWLLRPGYGYPLDDFRLRDLWKILLSEFKRAKKDSVLLQQLICLRRIAGGLNRGQQHQSMVDSLALLLPKRGVALPLELQRQPALYIERLRAVASMEWLEIETKKKLGEALINRLIADKGSAAEIWALGRIAARRLIYAPPSCIVPAHQCSQWLEKLMEAKLQSESYTVLIGQMARLTGIKEIDLPLSLRQRLLNDFKSSAQERLTALLTTIQPFNTAEANQAFGEELPLGLTLTQIS